ncbi:MAG: TRAP transporter small permease [Actinomycetaceae bacterium]
MDADKVDPPRPPTRRERVVRQISTALALAAGAGLTALFLINIVQIAARPLMGGWIWVNDLSRLLVTWVIMIGAAAAIGLREHLVVDLVQQRAPLAFRVISAYLVRAVELVIGVVLLVSGAVVAMERMNIQYIQLGIPTGFAYLAVPVLGLFLVLFGLLMNIRPPAAETYAAAEEGEVA